MKDFFRRFLVELMIFFKVFREIQKTNLILVQNQLDKLKNCDKHKNPMSLIPYGYKIYSQNEEDGMISEIFNRIGYYNKKFVEFGVGNGLENNTLALLLDSWTGLWIEASKKNTRNIRRNLDKTIKSGRLIVTNAFITNNNINELISSSIKEKEIDLLSIDIDGNDFHVFEAINCIQPRVVVIEYNAKFPPPVYYCMSYEEMNWWKGNDSFGASLKFLEVNMRKKGFILVGCNLSGSNAFFVREELVQDRFLAPFTAENHYEPPRYYLSKLTSGHPPSFSTIENQSSVSNIAYRE